MADKSLHPSWFKFRVERRALLRELPPKTTVDALLCCLDYLEHGEPITIEDPLTRVAFSVFSTDAVEAWRQYNARVESGRKGGHPAKNDEG